MASVAERVSLKLELDIVSMTLKKLLLRLLLCVSSTDFGGRLFVALLSPVDRWLLRRSFGRFSIAGLGAPTLLLTTSGRKTGQPRPTPLLYLSDPVQPGILHVIGSAGGRRAMPGWVLNLIDMPRVTVTLNGVARHYKARVLQGSQHTEIWQRFIAFNAGFGQYQGRLIRRIPVIELSPLTTSDLALPGTDNNGTDTRDLALTPLPQRLSLLKASPAPHQFVTRNLPNRIFTTHFCQIGGP